VGPLLARRLPALRYDAGLVGAGSEVLGFDTDRSTDHDFGPRCLLFLPRAGGPSPAPDDVAAVLDAGLPDTFRGYPIRFYRDGGAPGRPGGPVQVTVTTVAGWGRAFLGVDALGELTAADWLGIPTQSLAAATAGAVFHSGLGELVSMRERLAFYPDDVWRYVLAAQWSRVAEEEAFVGRTGEVGDDLGSAVLAARLVRDLMRLALLLRRRYPPYAKWLGSAFARLPDAATLGPVLAAALRAGGWREREQHLCDGYAHLARLQNELGIAAPVDPTCRPFHGRPFRVLDAQRQARTLRDAITDPDVRALPPLGGVDQFADSTELLTDPDRARAVTRAALIDARPARSDRSDRSDPT
jgi:hypothetical protein